MRILPWALEAEHAMDSEQKSLNFLKNLPSNGVPKENTRMKTTSLLVAAVLLLCACEGNTFRSYTVHNHSTADITVAVTGWVDSTYVIAPNNASIVHAYDQLGGNSRPGEVSETLSTLVIVQGEDTSVTNFLEQDHWIVNSFRTRRVPSSWEHLFETEVHPSDF